MNKIEVATEKKSDSSTTSVLIISFSDKKDAESYEKFLLETKKFSDPFPTLISADYPNQGDPAIVKVAPGWKPLSLKTWVNGLSNLFKTEAIGDDHVGRIGYKYMNPDFCMTMRKVFKSLCRSHNENRISGRLTVENYNADRTGIYVSQGSKGVIIICDKALKSDDNDPTQKIKDDLRGFKNLMNHIVDSFNGQSDVARICQEYVPNLRPVDYTIFNRLYDECLEDIVNHTPDGREYFAFYVLHCPLFWKEGAKKGDRVPFIEFMNKCHEENWLQGISCFQYPDGSFISTKWERRIPHPTPQQEQLMHQYTQKIKFLLHHVFHFGFDRFVGTYQRVGGIVSFLRNGIHHYPSHKDRYEKYERERIIRAQFPEVLPEMYLAMVNELHCAGFNDVQRFRDEFRQTFERKR